MNESTGGNEVLAALPQRDRDQVLKYCERITLSPDEVLGEPGEPIRQVYFPIDCCISIQIEVDRHDALAIGLIGSEGMLGFSLALGVSTSSLRTRVQAGGSAWRMATEDFQQLLIEVPALQRQLQFYLHALLAQFAQTAVCAAFHIVEVRLACWLLMIHDRAHADRFYLTHDRLARLLGVRRSGVTMAARVLHARKLINYTRGHIVVLDRKGLEQAACNCYRTACNAFRHAARSGQRRDELEHEAPALPQQVLASVPATIQASLGSRPQRRTSVSRRPGVTGRHADLGVLAHRPRKLETLS